MWNESLCKFDKNNFAIKTSNINHGNRPPVAWPKRMAFKNSISKAICQNRRGNRIIFRAINQIGSCYNCWTTGGQISLCKSQHWRSYFIACITISSIWLNSSVARKEWLKKLYLWNRYSEKCSFHQLETFVTKKLFKKRKTSLFLLTLPERHY